MPVVCPPSLPSGTGRGGVFGKGSGGNGVVWPEGAVVTERSLERACVPSWVAS